MIAGCVQVFFVHSCAAEWMLAVWLAACLSLHFPSELTDDISFTSKFEAVVLAVIKINYTVHYFMFSNFLLT